MQTWQPGRIEALIAKAFDVSGLADLEFVRICRAVWRDEPQTRASQVMQVLEESPLYVSVGPDHWGTIRTYGGET